MAALSRLTARSVVLSVLLGAHPAWASAAELIRLTADFGIRESTVRVALTRMVSAGDLIRSEDGYRLSDRLLARQRRQDIALAPPVRPWDGTWDTVVITSIGADARTRSDLRKALLQNRFGALREGVWLRPANLAGSLTAEVLGSSRVLHSRDDDPRALAFRLWDLSGWAGTGVRLLDEMANTPGMPSRFVTAAGMVRHLLSDPVLPTELLPDAWPGEALRQAYNEFAAELAARRDQAETVGAM